VPREAKLNPKQKLVNTREDEFLMTLTQCARLIQVERGTVSGWKDKLDFPTTKKNGRYDAREVVRWWIDWKFGDRNPEEDRKYHLECAKIEEQTRTAKIKNDELELHLVDRREVVTQITEWCTRIRTRVLQLGSEIANVVPGEMKAVIKIQVESRIRAVLQEAIEAELADEEIRQLIIETAAELQGE
jgi:hypothetical protein